MAIEMASSGGNDILMVSVRKSLREKLDVHTNAIERNNKKASCILLVLGLMYVILVLVMLT